MAACLLGACSGPVERVFSYSSDGPSRTGLVATPSGVLLGNEGGALALVDPAGRQVWKVMLGREVAARPVAVGDTVVAATVGGEWVGLSLQEGQERWRQPRQAQLTPLVSDGERVFSVAQDGAVEAFDVASATSAWARPPPPGLRPNDRRPFPEPLVHGELLLVALGDGGLFALGTRTGELKWKLPALGVTALAGEEGRIYAATTPGGVVALEAGTGRTLWSTHVGPVTSGLTLLSNRLWLGLSGNRLLAMDPEDGTEQFRATLPGPLLSRPVPYRELLLVPTAGQEGMLVGLRPPATEPVFRYRVDSPLRGAPVVRGDVVLVPAADGRVLGVRVKADTR